RVFVASLLVVVLGAPQIVRDRGAAERGRDEREGDRDPAELCHARDGTPGVRRCRGNARGRTVVDGASLVEEETGPYDDGVLHRQIGRSYEQERTPGRASTLPGSVPPTRREPGVPGPTR